MNKVYRNHGVESELKRQSGKFRFLATLLLLCFSIVIWNCGGRNDSFVREHLKLTSDKTNYVVGDTITLKFEITFGSYIRVFKDRRKSLMFFFAVTAGNQRDTSDHQIWSLDVPRTDSDVIDTIDATFGEPLCVTVKGLISKPDDAFLFDFGEFGKFNKHRLGTFEVQGHWQPIKPHPMDSEGYYTNRIYFQVSEEGELP